MELRSAAYVRYTRPCAVTARHKRPCRNPSSLLYFALAASAASAACLAAFSAAFFASASAFALAASAALAAFLSASEIPSFFRLAASSESGVRRGGGHEWWTRVELVASLTYRMRPWQLSGSPRSGIQAPAAGPCT